MSTTCFRARSERELRVLLVRYGAPVPDEMLTRLVSLLEERFSKAVRGTFRLRVLATGQSQLKFRPRDLDEVRRRMPGSEAFKSPERLRRLWYYYHPEVGVASEALESVARSSLGPALGAADAVLVLSEPQFEGIGKAPGGLAMTEYPMEVAWETDSGGSTIFSSNEALADELLHELGHVLGLNHASDECFRGDASTPEALAELNRCCSRSPGRDDVMSYCRGRDQVDQGRFYGFTDCTLGYLEASVWPRLLSGGSRPMQAEYCP